MELTPFLSLMGILLITYLVIVFSTKLIRFILGAIIVVGIISYIVVPKNTKIKMDNFAQHIIGEIKSNTYTNEIIKTAHNFNPQETLNTLKSKLDNIKNEK